MKPISTSKSTVFALFTIAILLFASSCKKKYTPLFVDPAYAAYVISFTSGVVSNSSTVQVRLVQQVPEAVAGKALSENPFSFSSEVKGTAG